MRIRINKLGALGGTVALLAATASLADTPRESMTTDVDGRWIPSISINGGALLQYMDSSVMSRCQNGRPERTIDVQPGPGFNFVDRNACADPDDVLDDPLAEELMLFPEGVPDNLCPGTPSLDGRSACLRPPADGEDAATSPFVGVAGQLMTPRIGIIPGRPRAFVGGGFLAIFAQTRKIAQEGTPAGIGFPTEPVARINGPTTAVAGPELTGAGSRVQSEVQRFAWTAHGGLAFPFELFGRRLWLKPSFGWIQYEVDFEGLIVAGIKADRVQGLPAPPFPEFPPPRPANGIREVIFSSAGSETFDAIGPGLEIEMEVGRYGPLGVALFLNGYANFVMGDRSFKTSASRTCERVPDDNLASGCAPAGLFEDRDPGPAVILTPVTDALVRVQDSPTTFEEFQIGTDTYTAELDFGVDPAIYRGSVGIRFHWLGR